MNHFFYLIIILFVGISYGQPKDILVNWECNMEIEILSGRFDPANDTVATRGNFNFWTRHDLIVDPLNSNKYISEFPDIIDSVQVGELLVQYKFFYTPYVWENGDDNVHILTQEEYNAGEVTISESFNDITMSMVTNQETTIQFTVDCNDAVSAINGLPFQVINTCHIAGETLPLQWPSTGWPDNQINLMIPLYDDGTNGDPTAGDDIFNALVTFPPYTEFNIYYRYGINYGDWINNGGGNDNENGVGETHIIELEQLLESAQVLNVFGQMGLHQLTNKVYVPLETSVSINNGWNILSVPVSSNDMTGTTLFPTAISPFYSYSSGYNQVTMLQNGEGYWAKFDNNQNITISGTIVNTDQISVNQGWNLIGPFEITVPVSGITSAPPNIIVSPFFGYEGGYTTPTDLLPGKGYWVKTSQSGTLNLNTNP